MSWDTIIVGAGLFGQVVAAELRRLGQRVEVIDRGEPLAGSGPAACLMKPSWFAGLGREVYEPALETLARLYELRDLPFEVHGPTGKMARATVHWINPRHILGHPRRCADVAMAGPRRVTLARGDVLEASNVIVAAGVWTQELLPHYRQGWQRGLATLYPDVVRRVPQGVIKPWAPYRQLVGFDRGDGLWIGDGSAIKNANWSQSREEEILARERKLALRLGGEGLPQPQVLQGLRPYWSGLRPFAKAPCLLEQVEPGLWVASGGAKNGTLAAGWCAHMIGRELQ